MIKIAVTELEYYKAEAVFEAAVSDGFECLPAPAEERELANFIRNKNALHVIIGVNKYTGELYNALPQGGVIARFGVGCDGVDKVKAAEKGLLCTNTPGVLDLSVAECAIGLMLTTARHFFTCIMDNKNGIWENRLGMELSGKNLAIIGCGAIGKKTAAIAAFGFGMKVIGFDVADFNLPELREKYGISHIKNVFADAVSDADFVSMHIPDIPETKDFINAERLAQIPSKAILINTARGSIVDENALYDALVSGKLAGAALDVFKVEPYIPQSRDKDLRTLNNVIMTPHISSSTAEACERMAKAALKHIPR
jgi:lactate dehydrogenase-like 2-hydroxyacid dehydrogenase